MEKHSQLDIAEANGSSTRISYYDDGGEGPALLLLHGFAGAALTWEPLLEFLPEHSRVIRMDAKGFGGSDLSDPENLGLGEQFRVSAALLESLELDHLTLVAHSSGCALALRLAEHERTRGRIERLILLDAVGLFGVRPPWYERLSEFGVNNPLVRFSGDELSAYLLLRPQYFREEKISVEMVRAYSEWLCRPGARDSVIAANRQFSCSPIASLVCANRLPTLVLWGAEDRIAPAEQAADIHRLIPDARIHMVPDCGHLPQEECPEETASLIRAFLAETDTVTEESASALDDSAVEPTLTERSIDQIRSLRDTYSLRMRSLFDRWSPGTLVFLCFIKSLQVLKKLGMRSDENGWRKATGIFLRSEYSKFVLSSFRLNAYRVRPAENLVIARAELIERLSDYIRSHSELQWSASPGMFQLGRERTAYTDIAEAFYDASGELMRIELHFDRTRDTFQSLTGAQIAEVLQVAVILINRMRRRNDGMVYADKLASRLRRWARRTPGFGGTARQELKTLFERLLSATFLHCGVLPADPESARLRRLASPNLRKYRNPGWGMLNIIARFTADFREVDLWIQCHHVPVDGMPMQEMLASLKKQWGCAGILPYPTPGTAAAQPEILYAGHRLFRCRFFVDFRDFLALRRELNEKYSALMEGPASVAGMVMWGLAQHRFFRSRKVLFPVDMQSHTPGDRELGLVFIRAGRFLDAHNPLSGFLIFQKEFNQRLQRTRVGESESYELLELYSMIHPLFYKVGHSMMPFAMGEMVGSMGLSILRDAEIFISPLSELQVNGFMTMGSLTHPTEDGGTAGAVCACGTREQLRFYREAVYDFATNYRKYLFPED